MRLTHNGANSKEEIATTNRDMVCDSAGIVFKAIEKKSVVAHVGGFVEENR